MVYDVRTLQKDLPLDGCVIPKGTKVDITYDKNNAPYIWHFTGIYLIDYEYLDGENHD